MAIAFDANSGAFVNPGTSRIVAHTCAGSDRGLFVDVVADTSSDLITGVTYAGVPMTLIAKSGAGGRWTYLFYIAAPATGTNNIIASASSECFIEVNAASYTGVSQTAQPEVVVVDILSSDASSTDTDITTLTDGAWVVAAGRNQAGGASAGAGTVLRNSALVGSILDSGGPVSPAGLRTIILNQAGSSPIGLILVSIAPAATDTTPPSLSSPVATATGSSSGTLGCTTANDANGTMYFVGTGSTTVPSKAQVKAGQDHTSALLASGRRPTLAITSTGAKSAGLTGLSASTTYHGYAMHEDAAGNQSDVLYLGSFTTSAPNTPPTFPGPNIPDMTAKRGQNIGTLDVSGRFSDTDALTFSAVGSWPAGVTISSAGVITRAPTAVPAVYSGLQVRATDTGGNTQDSNAFSFTVQQCVLALNATGYEIGDGNSAATMAVLASTSLNIAAYLASEWPPVTPLAAATASTDTVGRLANLGDDDFLFGTLYQVLLRNPADGERWIWTMQAS